MAVMGRQRKQYAPPGSSPARVAKVDLPPGVGNPYPSIAEGIGLALLETKFQGLALYGNSPGISPGAWPVK
jgi:hypothetical protein